MKDKKKLKVYIEKIRYRGNPTIHELLISESYRECNVTRECNTYNISFLNVLTNSVNNNVKPLL